MADGVDVVLGATLDNIARSLRAVVGSCVSHLDDDKDNTRKVSHLAQTEEGERWAFAQGYTVVGRFEDLGVSAGKTTPFERADLGKWLTPDRIHEWDVLVFGKIDRASRSTTDCVEFRCGSRLRRCLISDNPEALAQWLGPPGLMNRPWRAEAEPWRKRTIPTHKVCND